MFELDPVIFLIILWASVSVFICVGVDLIRSITNHANDYDDPIEYDSNYSYAKKIDHNEEGGN